MIVLHLLPLAVPDATDAAWARVGDELNRPGAVPSLVLPFGRQGEDSEARLVGGVDSGVEAVGILLSLVRSGVWAVVVEVAEGRAAGESLLQREAGRARRASGLCVVLGLSGPSTAWIEPALQLLGALERRRSEPQQDAGRRVEAGASQREVAVELQLSQQAVHARLRGGLWNETRALAGAAADVLDAVARVGGRIPHVDASPSTSERG